MTIRRTSASRRQRDADRSGRLEREYFERRPDLDDARAMGRQGCVPPNKHWMELPRVRIGRSHAVAHMWRVALI